MKLYFYHLSQPLGEKSRIEVEECEVEEKPRTYKAVDKFPRFYIGTYVKKENIGKINDDTIILTERDSEKAVLIFKEKLYNDIEWNHNRIKNLRKEIERSYNFLNVVDDWRLDNETH